MAHSEKGKGRPNVARRNHLLKVVEAQEITLEHRSRGATYKWIWENHISQRYHVTYNTFMLWLGQAARRELKEIEEWEKSQNT